jgi:hypothetical protein
MGPEPPGPQTDGSLSCRPVLSSESAPYLETIIIQVTERKGIIWSRAPIVGTTPRETGRLTVGSDLSSTLRGRPILKHEHTQPRINFLVIVFEGNEAGNICAGEDQRQFNRSTAMAAKTE